MRAPPWSYIPAALALVTDIFTTVLVRAHQPEYPFRFVVFQVVMFGAALLCIAAKMWVRLLGFCVLLAGALISGFSVGMFYYPSVFAAGWIALRGGSSTR
jgi:hypothetical protein